ncbi:hypothetical protein [Mammaliicoccus sciuri]|nr:hypothetical protein [Mammaliicoccus sciuri]MDL0113115.1 hypothetical protein [Mammaliicoccus sciuri]
MEKEFVGKCAKCQTDIYCNSGFIEGVVQEDKTLLCFDCSNEKERKETIMFLFSLYFYTP